MKHFTSNGVFQSESEAAKNVYEMEIKGRLQPVNDRFPVVTKTKYTKGYLYGVQFWTKQEIAKMHSLNTDKTISILAYDTTKA